MKAGAYRDLIPAATSESQLETLLDSFCTYLRDAPAKTESPAEWMIHFRRMTMPWGPLAPGAWKSPNARSGAAAMV